MFRIAEIFAYAIHGTKNRFVALFLVTALIMICKVEKRNNNTVSSARWTLQLFNPFLSAFYSAARRREWPCLHPRRLGCTAVSLSPEFLNHYSHTFEWVWMRVIWNRILLLMMGKYRGSFFLYRLHKFVALHPFPLR